jgi:8-oxo-dGTP pyrophosphatase MutT (NUDIX family)
VFGRLRGSNAVIESQGRFLVLKRNDDLGLCFPGGLAARTESNLDALRRELKEETGLVLLEAHECFSFESDLVLPATTTVFTATAEGTPRASWEGIPLWLTLTEIDQDKIFAPHHEILNYLKASANKDR